MLVVLKPESTAEHRDQVLRCLDEMELRGYVVDGARPMLVEVLGINGHFDRVRLEQSPMVDRLVDRDQPVLAAGREEGDQTQVVPLGAHASLGSRRIGVIAGPCSVESEDQILRIAAGAKEAGAGGLRGGAFKPRTSPYSFQGHEEQGLAFLAKAREQTGLAIVTEVLSCEHVDLVSQYADVLQVGSRNMHHTPLLTAVGRQSKPVLLKRGWSATLEEFLFAAEYIMLQGNRNVILCERGIRTHEKYVRNTLALAVVPEVKRISNLPIIVDPSHGTGQPHLVAPMSNAAVACGADGLLIEVHHDPSRAWTDRHQTLDIAQFQSLMRGLEPFAEAAGRGL